MYTERQFMWPFLKTKTNEVVLTDEESTVVNPFYKGVMQDEKTNEYTHRALISQGLCMYADGVIGALNFWDGKIYDQLFNQSHEKACAAVLKAIQIHDSPVYSFLLAHYLEHWGRLEEAKPYYQQFIIQADTFQPSEIDKSFLKYFDKKFGILKSVKTAQSKLSQ